MGPDFSFDMNLGEKKAGVEIHVLEKNFLNAYTSPDSPWCFTQLTQNALASMVPSALQTLPQLVSLQNLCLLMKPSSPPQAGFTIRSFMSVPLSLLLKNKTTGTKWSHFCSAPLNQNEDLIWLHFLPSQNRILNRSIRNHLTSTSCVIWQIDLCHPLGGNTFAITNRLFCQKTSLFPLPSAYKSLSFCTTPWSSCLLDGMLPQSSWFLLK